MLHLTDSIDNPIPRPGRREDLLCDTSKGYPTEDACYPLDASQRQSWGLSEIFGRPIKGSCLGAITNSTNDPSVSLRVPQERDVYISGGAVEHLDPGGFSRSFTLPVSADFDMMLPQQDLSIQSILSQPLLYAERSMTGHGQERGGVQAILTNPSTISPVEFIYLESLPWFMKPYLHTLTAKLSDQHSGPKLIKDIYYRPAVDRSRGTHLEIHLLVPAASTVILTYDFEKAILRYTEYPPDANRGFDVAPAVIRLLSNTSSESVYLRTTSLLLPLPTPDFSMPYNVIILTSTVIALAFGSIYNLLVRRFVGADEVEGAGFVERVKNGIRGRIAKWKQSRTEKKTQ